MRIIRLLSIAGRPQITLPALKVALVVGTVLNLVNQGGNQSQGWWYLRRSAS